MVSRYLNIYCKSSSRNREVRQRPVLRGRYFKTQTTPENTVYVQPLNLKILITACWTPKRHVNRQQNQVCVCHPLGSILVEKVYRVGGRQ